MKKALILVLALIFIISLLFGSGCKFLLRDAGSGTQEPSVETVTPEKAKESNGQQSEDPDDTTELAIRDFELSALLEELKTMPTGSVWDFYCESRGAPLEKDLRTIIGSYDKEVTRGRI